MYREKLLKSGIPVSIRGFFYLNEALMLYKRGTSICELYKDVAKKFDTSPSRVERAIRHALTFVKGDQWKNREFIAAHKLVIWHEKEDINT